MKDNDSDFEFNVLPLPTSFNNQEIQQAVENLEECTGKLLNTNKMPLDFSNKNSQNNCSDKNQFVELVYPKSNSRINPEINTGNISAHNSNLSPINVYADAPLSLNKNQRTCSLPKYDRKTAIIARDKLYMSAINNPGSCHNFLGSRMLKNNLLSSIIPLNYINHSFWDFQQYDVNKDSLLSYEEVVTVIDNVCQKFKVKDFKKVDILETCCMFDEETDGFLNFEEYKNTLLHLIKNCSYS